MIDLSTMSLSLVAVSGIALYIGLTNLLYYLYHEDPGARRDPNYLTFVWVCLSFAAYDFFAIPLYAPGTLADYDFWIRAECTSMLSWGAALNLFVPARFDLDRKQRAVVVGKWLACFYLLLTLTMLLPDRFLFTGEIFTREVHALGIQVTYHEVRFTPLVDLIMLIGCFGCGYLCYFMVLAFRQGRARENVWFIVACGLFCTCALLDLLTSLEIISFFYTMEYGFLAVLLVMDFSQVKRFVEKDNKLREMNLELARNMEQLKEVARLKNEILARTTHELRTPLNAIINLPDLVLENFSVQPVLRCEACHALFHRDDGPPPSCPSCQGLETLLPDEHCQYAGDLREIPEIQQRIADSGRSLLQIVNNILVVAEHEGQRGALHLSEFTVGELIEQVLAVLTPQAIRKEIRLSVGSVEGELRLWADRLKIEQSLCNVLDNSIKFSPPGSEVLITWTQVTGGVSISVRDQGIGIAREDLGVIFESFRQVNEGATRKFGGVGLGLSVAKSLLELHGGDISVDSETGKGSTFRVRLPLAPP